MTHAIGRSVGVNEKANYRPECKAHFVAWTVPHLPEPCLSCFFLHLHTARAQFVCASLCSQPT